MARSDGYFSANTLSIVIVLVLTVSSAVYWSAYAYNAYTTFHEYWDLGQDAYALYFNTHYPQIAAGLQQLIFGAHIAPDMLLLEPLYLAAPSPLTLLYFQAVLYSFVAVLIYFVTRDLTKLPVVALVIAAAYLLTPAMHSMLVYDFHVEEFIPLFYILTFYFYMKSNTKAFYASLFFLCATLDGAVPLIFMLGVGLLLYEFLYNRNSTLKRQRIRMAAVIVVASLAAAAFYTGVTWYLTAQYSTSYHGLPQALEISGGQLALLSNVTTTITSPYQSLVADYNVLSYLQAYLVYALVIVFLSFGVCYLFDWPVALVLLLPWLAGAFARQGDVGFIFTWNQYYVYAIGPMVVAAIIAFALAKDGRTMFGTFLRKRGISAIGMLQASCIVLAIFIAVVSPIYLYSKNINNLQQDLLFQVNSSIRAQDAQLYSMLALIPPNASVIGNDYIVAHLTSREYVCSIFYCNYPSFPQYMIVDFNTNISENAYLSYDIYYHYATDEPYYLYAQNGTALVYKRSGG